MKLYIPDKTFMKGIPKWNLQKTCDGDLFSRSVRQESDVYDLDLFKYMTKRERGILRPDARTTSTVGGTLTSVNSDMKPSTSPTRQTRYLATNSLKWDPNNFMPTLLNSEKPLLDNSNTPRGAKRAITLERTFDSFA
jgi:hypothetical protein